MKKISWNVYILLNVWKGKVKTEGAQRVWCMKGQKKVFIIFEAARSDDYAQFCFSWAGTFLSLIEENGNKKQLYH